MTAVAERLAVRDPATGEVLAQLDVAGAREADEALEAAAQAQRSWRRVPVADRARIQHRAAATMLEHADELADLLCSELGRPPAGCRTEIERTAALLGYFAEEAQRIVGQLPMLGLDDERVCVTYEPLGVVVAIAPFNYPITLLGFKLGAALVTGNAVVAKPAEDTPLSTLRLVELLGEAGFPPGVVTALVGGRELGEHLVAHPRTAAVGFTGSTRAGQAIHQLAARTTKRVTLELGGNCPAIVLEDADVEAAAAAIVRHAFSNSGQFCYRVNRVHAHVAVHEALVEAVVARARALRVGHPRAATTDLGPLVGERILATSQEHVADARARGARVRCGGERLTGGDYDGGCYFPPTVLADADPGSLVMTQETFGPVLGMAPFEQVDAVLEAADASPHGLAAYVLGRDLAAAWRVAEELHVGSVWVNDIHRSLPMVPFGGTRQSGLGREKSAFGLHAYLEPKTTYLGLR